MKALVTLLIVVFLVDTWATIAYDDVSCVMANHHWLAIIGTAVLSSAIGALYVRARKVN